jgi:alpha-ribazole phosphatase
VPERTILYVRHAESVANSGGITMPNNDIPLAEAGRSRALELAEILPASPTLVLVSRALRTQQTAEPYCRRTGAVPVVEPLLDELSIICPS